MVTESDLRELSLALSGTSEKPSWGMPGVCVGDRLFARLRERLVSQFDENG